MASSWSPDGGAQHSISLWVMNSRGNPVSIHMGRWEIIRTGRELWVCTHVFVREK